jgi:muconolactone delta-isomerase
MQFLVVARPKANLVADKLPPDYEALLHLEQENAKACYANETLRQIWHCADAPGVAIIFEAKSFEHLQEISNTFPLFAAGYLDLSIVPLEPYAGFSPNQKSRHAEMSAK